MHYANLFLEEFNLSLFNLPPLSDSVMSELSACCASYTLSRHHVQYSFELADANDGFLL